MRLLNEVAAGHDGPPIPEAKRVFFQERFRGRFFEFLVERFLLAQTRGLTKAKLARRIGKPPEVVNRWLGAPSNLTLDSVSDLLLGISAEEPEMSGLSLLNRSPVNYSHLNDVGSAMSEPKPRNNPQEGAGSSLASPPVEIKASALTGIAQ
jgi:hypothetical protein